MTKKYVLTGGPGSGKSSILLALEARGEYIIREAAEDYIRRRQAQGVKEPWAEEDFQDKVLELQVHREDAIAAGTKRAFIDRGLADGWAYYQAAGRQYTKALEDAVNRIRREPYDGIFLVENLGSCETNEVRREDLTAALELERKQEENYKDIGYEVTRIPAAPLEQRVEAVLKQI